MLSTSPGVRGHPHLGNTDLETGLPMVPVLPAQGSIMVSVAGAGPVLGQGGVYKADLCERRPSLAHLAAGTGHTDFTTCNLQSRDGTWRRPFAFTG